MKVNVNVDVEMYKELTNVINDRVCEVVEELGEEYNFDIEEGKKKVKVEVVKRCEKSESKIVLPYTGTIIDGRCNGIKANYGLYSQCMNYKAKKGYCLTCYKQSEKNVDGKPNNGNITDRTMDYKDKNGKIPVKYIVVMKKMNLTREMVECEAQKLGIRIPEEEFEMPKTQRGRPKKSTPSDAPIEQKKRGRPRKEKKVIENGNECDDLIQNLVKQAQKQDDNNAVADVQPEPNPNVDIQQDDSSETDEEEEEETSVVIFKIGDVNYLKAADNTLYDFKTHEVIGVWNAVTKAIDPEDEDEDED